MTPQEIENALTLPMYAIRIREDAPRCWQERLFLSPTGGWTRYRGFAWTGHTPRHARRVAKLLRLTHFDIVRLA